MLAAADLFVFPAATGGAPTPLVEAMAAGLPIVTLDTADHREVLAGEGEAILVRAATAQRFAAAILRLLRDRALAERLGAAARRRTAQQFSSDRMAGEHLRLFASLVEKARAGA